MGFLKQLSSLQALILGCFIAAFFGYFYLDFGKFKQQLQNLENQVKVIEESVTTKKAQFEKLVVDPELFDKTSLEYSRKAEFFRKEINQDAFSRLISSEAQSVGINIISISKSSQSNYQAPSEEAHNFKKSIGVDMNVRGSFDEIMRFASNVTRLKEVVEVSSLNLRSNFNSFTESTAEEVEITADMSFKTYQMLKNKKSPDLNEDK